MRPSVLFQAHGSQVSHDLLCLSGFQPSTPGGPPYAQALRNSLLSCALILPLSSGKPGPEKAREPRVLPLLWGFCDEQDLNACYLCNEAWEPRSGSTCPGAQRFCPQPQADISGGIKKKWKSCQFTRLGSAVLKDSPSQVPGQV